MMAGAFAISDLHLPTYIQINKFSYPTDYFEQVREHLLKFNPDLLLIVGDFSYESNFRRGLAILEAIEELPGSKKVFIEGNHDNFCHNQKHQNFLLETFDTESFYYLSGRALITEVRVDDADNLSKVGLCGAMGWMVHPRNINQEDLIIFNNQLDLLKESLDLLESLREDNFSEFNICLLHHPPTYGILQIVG